MAEWLYIFIKDEKLCTYAAYGHTALNMAIWLKENPCKRCTWIKVKASSGYVDTFVHIVRKNTKVKRP